MVQLNPDKVAEALEAPTLPLLLIINHKSHKRPACCIRKLNASHAQNSAQKFKKIKDFYTLGLSDDLSDG